MGPTVIKCHVLKKLQKIELIARDNIRAFYPKKVCWEFVVFK